MNSILPTALLAILTLTTTLPAAHAKKAEWKLVWSDEFNGSKLNPENWARCPRGTPDWCNTMSPAPELLKLENGILTLYGVENKTQPDDPAPYLTAGITSKGKFEFRYGKVEIRARVKSAKGAWPALWMLGKNGGWPGNGEIDLMEHLNFDRVVYQTVHSDFTVKQGRTLDPVSSETARINRDDWNTYGCEWDENEIVFTVNGKKTFTYPRLEKEGKTQWPFDQPFYFIFSMQIGGDWVNRGNPTDPDDYPAGMAIDWVRVYKRIVPAKK